MGQVNRRIPQDTLETLLKHKQGVLSNINARYQTELADADKDSERLFKYGFIFVGAIEGLTGVVSLVLSWSDYVLFFFVSLMFLTLAVSYVFYERIRIEKDALRSTCNRERNPIMQQISLLNSFLEPEE